MIYMAALLLFAGCNQAELVDIVRLGAKEKEMTLAPSTVEDTIRLVTNMPYSVRVVSGEDWIKLAGYGLMPPSRTEIPFRCEANMGWRRMAKVALSAGSRADTVYIRQEGPLQDRISLKDKSYNIPAAGGTYKTEVECFRYPDRLLVDCSNKSWEASLESGVLTVIASPATSRDPKTHTVTVYYMDDWNEQAAAVATFNQAARE